MAKQFTYRGKTIEELTKLSHTQFAELLPARERRHVKRGLTELQKKLLETLKTTTGKPVKTHARDMIIIPEMVGKTLRVYTGKEFFQMILTQEMLGHRLGEFALTRKQVKHSAPGVGATRSSASMSVR